MVCLEEKCLLILFTSQLVIRSTCGGQRGSRLNEFDSPWSVVSLIDRTMPNLIVADSNNRRLQHFSISRNGKFMFRNSFPTKKKPFFLSSSRLYFAGSCEDATIVVFSVYEEKEKNEIDLNKIRILKSKKNFVQRIFISFFFSKNERVARCRFVSTSKRIVCSSATQRVRSLESSN